MQTSWQGESSRTLVTLDVKDITRHTVKIPLIGLNSGSYVKKNFVLTEAKAFSNIVKTAINISVK